jgi:hypothetical protein
LNCGKNKKIAYLMGELKKNILIKWLYNQNIRILFFLW